MLAVASWAEQPIRLRLGATLDLSGPYSLVGQAERDGLILAVEELNSKLSDLVIELQVEDNIGKASNAVTSARKLLDLHKVDVILSGFTHISTSVAPLVERAGKIFLYSCSIRDLAERSPLSFRDYPNIEDSGKLLAELVIKHGRKRVSFIGDQGEACVKAEDKFLTMIEGSGVEVVEKHRFLAREDFRPLLLRQKLNKTEALVLCDWQDAHTVMRQMAELQMLDLPTYHVVGRFLPIANSKQIRDLFEENGAISSWYGMPEKPVNKVQADFQELFRKRFGEDPFPDSGYSYDDVHALAKATLSCSKEHHADGGLNLDCIAKAFLKTDYMGVTGALRFDDTGNCDRPVFPIQVQHGEWVRLGDDDDY